MPTATAHQADEPRRRPRDRKQQILVAARDLFVEHGYPNVAMTAVAEKVGITAGALYRHFDTKAALLESVMVDNFAWLDEPLSATSFGEAVDDVLARVIDRPYLSDLWIHELRYLPDAQARTLRRRMRRWHRELVPPLRQERPGLDEGQGELLTWACLSLMSCVGRRAIRAPRSVRLPVVRAGIHALTRVELPPTGAETVATQTGVLPVSRRERLLLAAIEQFGRNGYHDTSMASIGAAADVTGPNLYGYFASKADLLQAVYERGTHALWLSLDEALMTAASPSEALTAVVRSFVGIARTWSAILDDPTVESGLADAALGAQREYVGEWSALVARSVPHLDARVTRLRVQLGLFLIADLYRNSRVSRRESFPESLEALVLAVLCDIGQ
ncbi:TetR/AcrR family transcriptional regulator [Actinophytocola gossypii]|uniref:TetR family transcriptional regulator n=1 Tax=Actinophytocola gossypii TaxID=2812003 RepID=A0ABT2J9R7_9PSEU|nr:TetR/AcrR family transcriptional regulator [Actinophytocola gossypii]MCT2584618.1 TetR family transcriptional regulator [Actinophytocola gossypii]